MIQLQREEDRPMTKEELGRKSVHAGYSKTAYCEEFSKRLIWRVDYDIKYFFNEKWEEIGHVVWPNDAQFEVVEVHDKPRVWGQCFLDKLHLIKYNITT